MITPLPSGPFYTNAYVLACPETKQAAIIDPAPESAAKIISNIQNHSLNPKFILLTHSHWDHIADTAEIKNHYKIPVYIHAEDAPNLIQPGSDGLPCWIDIPGVQPDFLLNDGDKISLGNLHLHVIHTPGHTPGGICLYCPELKILISGDTLFKGSIGNLSFPTARPNLMWDSLKKLSKLPQETIVYPGHGIKTTIGAESWLGDAESIFGEK